MIVPVSRYQRRTKCSCRVYACTSKWNTYDVYHKYHPSNRKPIKSSCCLFVQYSHEYHSNQEKCQYCLNGKACSGTRPKKTRQNVPIDSASHARGFTISKVMPLQLPYKTFENGEKN